MTTNKNSKYEQKRGFTFVVTSGYDLLTFRNPSNIFGNSDGLTGSTAIFITELVLNFSGRKIQTYDENRK